MYGFYKWVTFEKQIDILDLCKVDFYVSKLLIHCNTVICCVHVTSGVN